MTDSNQHSIRISLTEAEARVLLLAISNMEGDDDEAVNRVLDKVNDKIQRARRKRNERR